MRIALAELSSHAFGGRGVLLRDARNLAWRMARVWVNEYRTGSGSDRVLDTRVSPRIEGLSQEQPGRYRSRFRIRRPTVIAQPERLTAGDGAATQGSDASNWDERITGAFRGRFGKIG